MKHKEFHQYIIRAIVLATNDEKNIASIVPTLTANIAIRIQGNPGNVKLELLKATISLMKSGKINDTIIIERLLLTFYRLVLNDPKLLKVAKSANIDFNLFRRFENDDKVSRLLKSIKALLE